MRDIEERYFGLYARPAAVTCTRKVHVDAVYTHADEFLDAQVGIVVAHQGCNWKAGCDETGTDSPIPTEGGYQYKLNEDIITPSIIEALLARGFHVASYLHPCRCAALGMSYIDILEEIRRMVNEWNVDSIYLDGTVSYGLWGDWDFYARLRDIIGDGIVYLHGSLAPYGNGTVTYRPPWLTLIDNYLWGEHPTNPHPKTFNDPIWDHQVRLDHWGVIGSYKPGGDANPWKDDPTYGKKLAQMYCVPWVTTGQSFERVLLANWLPEYMRLKVKWLERNR